METLTINKSIELAITTERLGAKFYSQAAEKFAMNKEVNEVFDRLSKDELIHEAQFKALLDDVDKNDTSFSKEGLEYITATAMSKFFEGETFMNLDGIKTAHDALLMALEFEKSSLVYYQAISEAYGGNKKLDSIIKMEKGHVMAIFGAIMMESKFRGTEDRW